MNEIKIGQRLEKLRFGRAFSKEFVAEKLSLSVPGYSLMETGHNIISIEHIIKLSSLYGVTTDYLLKGINNNTLSDEQNNKDDLSNADSVESIN